MLGCFYLGFLGFGYSRLRAWTGDIFRTEETRILCSFIIICLLEGGGNVNDLMLLEQQGLVVSVFVLVELKNTFMDGEDRISS